MTLSEYLSTRTIEIDLASLLAEADSYYPRATRTETEKGNTRDAYGRLRSGRAHWISTGGPVLAEIHEGLMCRTVNETTVAGELFPTRSVYIYYEPGDYIGPHQDVQQCERTALVSLTEESSLQIYPAGYPGDEASALDRFLAGPVTGEQCVEMPKGSLVVIDGGRLIHAKRPSTKRCITAAFCFLSA